VSSSRIYFESIAHFPPPCVSPEDSSWYAVHTIARHEKQVAAQFQEDRICTFLPLLQQIHKWSDRRVKVEVPMFGCYAFVRIVQGTAERLKVLRTPGVLGFVGSERQGTPIPVEQIESLRTAMKEKIPCYPHAFLSAGKRVRIRGGSLDGMQGILVRQAGDQSLIVSVELLHRSIAVRVEGYDVELV
jgi:transcription antitermination factor NusG